MPLHDASLPPDLFSHYTPHLRTLPRLQTDAALPATFTLGHFRDGVIQYAPFDFVNPDARLVLVGLTPGRQQAVNALNAAAEALRTGADPASAKLAAKHTGSFSGALRTNLIDLLDHFGVQQLLGLGSCAALFADRGELVHFTSVLRYPVFNTDGSNYNRSPLAHPELERCVREGFFAELRQLSPTALFVPLGDRAGEALRLAVHEDRIAADRVLNGLVHPSGANAERIAYQLGRKPREYLSTQVDAARIDAASDHLRAQIARLRVGPAMSAPVRPAQPPASCPPPARVVVTPAAGPAASDDDGNDLHAQPLADDAEFIWVPVARDGSLFTPACATGNGFQIGPKEAPIAVRDYAVALAKLRIQNPPRWRRTNAAGNRGLVSAIGWRRLTRATLRG